MELNNIISTKNKEISEINGNLKAIKTKLDKYESNNTYDELDDFSRTLLHIIEYHKLLQPFLRFRLVSYLILW